MIRFVTISVCLLILLGCNNDSNESKKTVEPEKPFVLHANELSLLNFDSCSCQVSFDTIRFVSKYISSKEGLFASEKNSGKKFCVSFNFKNNDEPDRPKAITVNYTPIPHRSLGAILPADKFILLNISDSTHLYSILGGVHAFDGAKITEVHNYVRNFYHYNFDTGKMNDKFIYFHFLTDTVNYIENYLSQAVMGYILAQRDFSFEIFNKELQYATKQELVTLRTRLPFLFKMYARDISVIKK